MTIASLPALAEQANESTLGAYYEDLRKFDWSYSWSDDHSVFMRGVTGEQELKKRRMFSTAHESLWEQFYRYGSQWQSVPSLRDDDCPPMPERPE